MKRFYAISFALQLGFLIVVPFIGFIVFGIWLDNLFFTSPLFLILAVFAGAIFTYLDARELLAPILDKKSKD